MAQYENSLPVNKILKIRSKNLCPSFLFTVPASPIFLSPFNLKKCWIWEAEIFHLLFKHKLHMPFQRERETAALVLRIRTARSLHIAQAWWIFIVQYKLKVPALSLVFLSLWLSAYQIRHHDNWLSYGWAGGTVLMVGSLKNPSLNNTVNIIVTAYIFSDENF